MCVKIYVCEKKKNFGKTYAPWRGVLYCGSEVALIVLLGSLGVRKPPGGNFRRWFRILCQNFNRTYGCGDTVTGNFAEEIFPTRTFDISGCTFGPWLIIRCQNSKIMHRSRDIRLLTKNHILSHIYHVINTLICSHTYIRIHTYTYIGHMHTPTHIQ